MSDVTRSLASAINIRYHNILGTISGNEFNISHGINEISYDGQVLNVSASVGWDLITFAKNFGVIFKDCFGNYISNTLVPGWAVTKSGTGAVTKTYASKYGSVNFATSNTSSSAYISRRIVFPRKMYTAVGASKFAEAYDLYAYFKQASGTSTGKGKFRVTIFEPGSTATTIKDWTEFATPTKIDFDTYGISKCSDFSFYLDVGIPTTMNTSGEIVLACIFTAPTGLTVTTDDVPYMPYKGSPDIGKEGFVVSFDVADGSTTKKYVFRGCSMAVSERMATADDVGAMFSFGYKSMSVGETWS